MGTVSLNTIRLSLVKIDEARTGTVPFKVFLSIFGQSPFLKKVFSANEDLAHFLEYLKGHGVDDASQASVVAAGDDSVHLRQLDKVLEHLCQPYFNSRTDKEIKHLVDGGEHFLKVNQERPKSQI